MPPIEYDGIYGESDHWLTEEQVAAAESALVPSERPKSDAAGLVDVDMKRAERPRRRGR